MITSKTPAIQAGVCSLERRKLRLLLRCEAEGVSKRAERGEVVKVGRLVAARPGRRKVRRLVHLAEHVAEVQAPEPGVLLDLCRAAPSDTQPLIGVVLRREGVVQTPH